jgi:SAM-dependent methyltransferase
LKHIMMVDIPEALITSLDYSLRRHFIDQFYFRQVPRLSPGGRVLDLGGNKTLKRGRFDLGQYNFPVCYANLSVAKRPDVQADAALLPFKNKVFEAVICAELLEHLPKPWQVLKEVHRVLKPGGALLISAPFLIPIHGDPDDFGRYTDSYWRTTLDSLGFQQIAIEFQGGFFCVLSDMLRDLVLHWGTLAWPRRGSLRGILLRLIFWSRRQALKREGSPLAPQDDFYYKYTTGFGICALKKEDFS